MRADQAKEASALFSRARAARSPLLSDAVAEQIMQLMRSGQLVAGSRLPSERELADQLGVSRAVVREALRILETSGLLSAKRGSGRYVNGHATDRRPIPMADHWLELHREEMAELNHVMQLIEPEGVLEVPGHLVPQVAHQARVLYERARAAVAAGDAHLAAQLDGEFHAVLCQFTPNRLLRELILNLLASGTDSAHAVYAIPAAARNSQAHHLAIVEALEAGSREEASRLVREHAAVAYRYALAASTSPVGPMAVLPSAAAGGTTSEP